MSALRPDFKFSFSSLSTFETCPRAFYLQYVERYPQEENAYSQYGTFCHSILEGWAKDKLPSFVLASEYAAHFDEHVTKDFPPFPRGLWQKYYDQGLAYFQTFDELRGLGDFEILSAEKKFSIKVGGYTIVGLADLIIKDKATGDITVIDHKSKSSSSMDKDLDEYRRQLYIYAMYVHQEYGVWPKYLKFNLFRENKWVTEEFSEAALKDTETWIINTIDAIFHETQWKPSVSSYFCRYICGVFGGCPAQEEILHPPKKGKKNEQP